MVRRKRLVESHATPFCSGVVEFWETEVRKGKRGKREGFEKGRSCFSLHGRVKNLDRVTTGRGGPDHAFTFLKCTQGKGGKKKKLTIFTKSAVALLECRGRLEKRKIFSASSVPA